MLFVFHDCHAVLPVPFSLVVTCWERTDLLALLNMMLSCVFVSFPFSVLWYLIVLIPDLCLLPYSDRFFQRRFSKFSSMRLSTPLSWPCF